MALDDILGQVFVAIRGEGSHFGDDAEKIVDDGLGPVVARAAKAVAGIFIGHKAIGFAREGIAELEETEKVAAQTEAVLRSTGGAAGVTSAHINELAEAGMNLAGIDDEIIKQSENVFLQFDQIKSAGGIFDEAVTSAENLAVASGQSLVSASYRLGLALQNPIQAASLLRRNHVTLTKEQQQSIKQFVLLGDVASAQGVILEQVQRQVGGAAEAYGKTLPGQLDIAKESIKNAKASLVEGLAPALLLTSKLETDFAQGVAGLSPPLRTAVSAILGLGLGFVSLAPAIGSAISGYKALFPAVAASEAASASHAATQVAEATVTEATVVANQAAALAAEERTAAIAGLIIGGQAELYVEGELVAVAPAVVAAEEEIGAGASAMLGPIGLVVGAVTLAVTALAIFGSSQSAAVGPADDLTAALLKEGQAADDAVAKIEAQRLATNKSAVAAHLAGVSYDLMNRAVQNGTDDFGGYGRKIDEFQEEMDDGAEARKKLHDDLVDNGAAGTEFGKSLLDLVDNSKLSGEELLTYVQTIERLHNEFGASTSAAQQQREANEAVSNSVYGFTEAQKIQLTNSEKLYQAQQAYTASVSGVDSAQRGLASAVRGVESAERGAAAAHRSYESSLRSLANAQQAVVDAQEALRKALDAGLGGETAGKAELDLEEAKQRLIDANKELAETEKNVALGRLAPGEAGTQEERDKALLEARIAAQRAAYGVVDAERALEEAKKAGTSEDSAVISAQRSLIAANQSVEDATQAVTDARQGEIDAAQGIVDAKQGVVDAASAVTTAQQAQAEAQIALNDAQKNGLDDIENQVNHVSNQIAAYEKLRDTLGPDSPLRFALDGYIAQLRALYDMANMTVADASHDTRFGTSSGAAGTIKGATGVSMTVTRPTRFLFGEAGEAEDVLAVPHSQGGVRAVIDQARARAPVTTLDKLAENVSITLVTPDAPQSTSVIVKGLRSIRWNLGR